MQVDRLCTCGSLVIDVFSWYSFFKSFIKKTGTWVWSSIRASIYNITSLRAIPTLMKAAIKVKLLISK